MELDSKKKIVVVAKVATMIVAGLACGTVVGAVVKNIVPLDGLSKYNKAMIILGTGILGGIAGEAGGDYAAGVMNAVEETFNAIEKMFEEVDKKIENQEKVS